MMFASPQRAVLRCRRAGYREFERTVSSTAGLAHQAILECLSAAVYATDAEGRITFFNYAAARLWGRMPILGTDLWCGSLRLYWPDGRPMPHDQCAMALTLRTGTSVQMEAVAERPDGSRIPFSAHPTLLYDESGALAGAVNMLVDVTGTKRAELAQQQLSAIVDSSRDAIASKHLNGIIVSWNPGAERLFGYKAEEIIGKPVTILIPEDHQDEEPEILARIRRGEPIDHYETVRRRKDGSLVDISLSVSPVKDAAGNIIGASKIARDVSDKKAIERTLRQQRRRLATLNRIARTISQGLDLDNVVQSVTDIATELSGAKYGAFFYNVTDKSGDSYLLYALSGAPREAFENLSMPRNTEIFEPTFRGNGVVRSPDITKDARYGRNAPHRGMPEGHVPVTSYMAVPVMARSGEVLGGLFFGHPKPGIFTRDSELLVKGIAAHAAIAIENARLHAAAQIEIEERRRAEAAKEVLVNEIKHRVKNTLSTVQAISSQTFQTASPAEHTAFGSRIRALAGAYDLLTDEKWDRVSVSEVVDRALVPFNDPNQRRFALSGSQVMLDANTSVLLAMTVHELATNAVKYGALSKDQGNVRIDWAVGDEEGLSRLNFTWVEAGGPPVQAPTRKGFGSRLIEQIVPGDQGRANFVFDPQGLRCELAIAIGA